MNPSHVQRVQALKQDDNVRRIAFAQWYLIKCAKDSLLPDKVLFFDEASFTKEGIFNTRNAHLWAKENPHTIRRRRAQT